MSTDHVLDLIDGVIQDYTSPDSMRWAPEPPPNDAPTPLTSIYQGWASAFLRGRPTVGAGPFDIATLRTLADVTACPPENLVTIANHCWCGDRLTGIGTEHIPGPYDWHPARIMAARRFVEPCGHEIGGGQGDANEGDGQGWRWTVWPVRSPPPHMHPARPRIEAAGQTTSAIPPGSER